jgi:hypothetical protein
MEFTKIKISSTGQELPANATEWDAVKITELGVMFARSNLPGGRMSAAASKKALASFSLAGFSDWREPERLELESILDLKKYSPAIDEDFFTDTESDWYRTSTPFAWSSGHVWIVHFDSASVSTLHRDNEAFVRPVRSLGAGQ